jgi:hypothetical protein
LRIKIGLGTAQFGLAYGIANQQGQLTREAAKEMLQLASQEGIDVLDTAIAYGDSEACLGEIGTQSFKLVTKLPQAPEDCADVNAWVHAQVQASLSRLKVKAIDGLLLHRPQQLLAAGGKALFQALQNLKQAGLVKKVGVSIYAPNELDALTAQYHFDLVQSPFNLVDRRLHTSGWLQRLNDEGIEIHTRSAFLQGLLLIPRARIPAKFSPWTALWDKWHTWLVAEHIDAVHACLAYPLSFAQIGRVIVGADSENHLQQILDMAQRATPASFPDLSCEEDALINPALWGQL